MPNSNKIRGLLGLPQKEEVHAYLVPLNGHMENPVYEILSEEIEIGSDPNLDLYIPQSSDPIPRISLKINKKKGFLEVCPLTPTSLIKINGRSLEKGNFVKPGETLTVGNVVFRFHFQRHMAFEENKYIGGIKRKKLLYVFVGLLTLWVLLDEEVPQRSNFNQKSQSRVKRKASNKKKNLSRQQREEIKKMNQLLDQAKRENRLKNYRRAHDLLRTIIKTSSTFAGSYEFSNVYTKTNRSLKESANRILIRMELLVEQRKGKEAMLEACNLDQLIGGIESHIGVDFKLKKKLKELYRGGLIPHPYCN